jgi:transposase
MARPRKPLDACKEGPLVLARWRTERAGPARERLRAVKLGLEGELDLDAIAKTIGRARSVIQEWFDHFRRGGVAELLKVRRGKGPPSRLTPDDEQFLRAGLEAGTWRTAAEVHAALRARGVEVKPGSVYHYLGKFGARLRVPRPTHLKKDPAATEAFKTQLAEKLAALAIEPERSVRLWVMDEMRCGLHTEPRRVWGVRGMRPVVTVQQKYEWEYVYGALEVGRGEAQFWYAPTVDLDCNRAFLEQLATADPTSVHVIIYDGAGFHHRDGHTALPANVRIINLPPYSPELNPVEKLWDAVRDGICNRVFATLAHLEKALCVPLRRYWENPANVLSLLGQGWLHTQANASGPNVLPV